MQLRSSELPLAAHGPLLEYRIASPFSCLCLHTRVFFMTHLLFLLLSVLTSATCDYLKNPEMAECMTIRKDVISFAESANHTENQLDLIWKKTERYNFNSYVDCLKDVVMRTKQGENATKELLKILKQIGRKFDFMVGEFARCYDSLLVNNFEPLVNLLASKSPETCEFSVTELGKLESLFLGKCSDGEAISKQLRSPLAQKMMCGSSFKSIVLDRKDIDEVDYHLEQWYEKSESEEASRRKEEYEKRSLVERMSRYRYLFLSFLAFLVMGYSARIAIIRRKFTWLYLVLYIEISAHLLK